MRIIAGTYGGRRIFYPLSGDIRPTPDKVRESIFNIIRGRTEGAAVLDLFAGTGAAGIEFLSAGASSAVFADKSPLSIKTVKRNLTQLNIPPERYRVIPGDWEFALKLLRGERFDFIFLDPPFKAGLYTPLMQALLGGNGTGGGYPNGAGGGYLTDGGTIIIEHSAAEQFAVPAPARLTDRRTYGGVSVTFVTR
jgi:16S rRNA (guanine(966)-N(2))-methyltransferase RsmD